MIQRIPFDPLFFFFLSSESLPFTRALPSSGFFFSGWDVPFRSGDSFSSAMFFLSFSGSPAIRFPVAGLFFHFPRKSTRQVDGFFFR